MTTHLSVEPHAPIRVEFIPPNGRFPPHYSVSVRADLTHLAHGCVVLRTAVTGKNFYYGAICGDGRYGLAKSQETATAATALGKGVATTVANHVYTITVTTDATGQHLFINGVEVVTSSDKTLANTADVELDADTTQEGGSAALSHFAFAPLP